MGKWEFYIDVGGTFTDCLGKTPMGNIVACKVLSGDNAAIRSIRQLMQLAPGDPIGDVVIRLGTTKGTNALLERKGAKVVLLTTKGFADLWKIGTQARPKLFELHIAKPTPLYTAVREVHERLSSEGTILSPLSKRETQEKLEELKNENVDSIAICFLNSYCNSKQENEALVTALKMNFQSVAISSEVSPTIKFLDRGDTVILEA